MDYRVISADGHVIEPPDLWSRHLPQRFHDRMPRLVKDPEGGDAWQLVPGTPPMPLGLVTNSGQWGKRYEDNGWYGSTYESIRQGAFDGKERLREQDIDGIEAEVIYPSQRTMGTFMAQEDDAYHLAGLEAYNTWLRREFMAVDPARLIGLAQMPAIDVATAISWLRAAKSEGFRGVILSAYPSGGAELSPDDDPFWEVAEAEQMPVHIHSGLAHAGKRRAGAGAAQRAATASFSALPGLQQMGGAVATASEWLSRFIYSGMFDRFPQLQMAAVETGAGWVPHFLEHMDDHWWRNRVWTGSSLQMLPSDYFRRNWKITFIREPFTMQVRHHIGVGNLMFSTDYPHHRHDWPYSRRVIEETMVGVPADEKHRMICANAVDFYRLNR